MLLPVEKYEQLADDAYDDSPWSREELEAAAWARMDRVGPDDDDNDDATSEAW